MIDYEQLNTVDLVNSVLNDPAATERELVLVSRLQGALEEVDALNKDVVVTARELAASVHGDS